MTQPPSRKPDAIPKAPAVRLAWPTEAGAIAELQRRSWDASGRGELLSGLSDDDLSEAWTQAIIAPPMAHFRVLVAHDGTGVTTGFVAIGPSDDPDAGPQDGEIAEFVVDRAARGQGHGSRLLRAAVDTLRSDGYLRAVWWIGATDEELREFAHGAGWGPDGAHREVGLTGPELNAEGAATSASSAESAVRWSQVRLHTDISG